MDKEEYLVCKCGRTFLKPARGRRKWCNVCRMERSYSEYRKDKESKIMFGYRRYSKYIREYLGIKNY